MRKKFGLIGGDIHVHRTIAFAAFAGETQIERFFNRLVVPSALQRIAVHHFKKQMAAAPRGVHFFAGHTVAGTHGLAFHAPAFTHTHAAQAGVGEIAVIFGIMEVRLRPPGIVVRSEPQILVAAVSLHDFAGIHLPLRIPDGFELAKRFHQFRAKHFFQQLGARLPVAMLAGERAAVADDNVRRLSSEVAILGDAFFRH